MNITLHFIENERWMEIQIKDENGKEEHFFGRPGRWHKPLDGMKYITSNSDINQLDRVFFVAEAKMLFQECMKSENNKSDPVVASAPAIVPPSKRKGK